MTNINCNLNCSYQIDGKCTLDSAEKVGYPNDKCTYYSPLTIAELKKTPKK